MTTPAGTHALMTMPALKQRGWTDAMVRELLGSPDERRTNPRYRSAPAMRLWREDRVVKVEQSAAFAERRVLAQRRSAASTAAAERARDQAIQAAERVRFRVPSLAQDELVRLACSHYNDRALGSRNGGDLHATPGSDQEFLDRISVNYLRHELTVYEGELDGFRGRVGRRDAVDEIRSAVYGAIATTYPYLAGECWRQEAARSMTP